MEYKARERYQSRKIVETYDAERFTSFKGRLVDNREKSLIRKALRFVNLNPPALILDIPCGTGRLSVHLASEGFRIRAVDLSPEMVRYTLQKAKKVHLEKKIIADVGDAENLPYSDNSFDACISLRLFGHTPPDNRVAILKELSRVTRQYLVLAYCNKNCLQYFLRKKRRERKKNEWYLSTYECIEKELKITRLKKLRCFSLLMGFSETTIVLAKKTR